MAETKQVLIPDIGDFKDVPVIEVLVKPGDSIKAEDSLIVLESDKATIEVPSPFAGIIRELSVKVGDKVCFTTEKAADGTQQIAKLVAVGDQDKVRVREKDVDVDAPSKVEVETPNKKIEVK